MKVYLKEKNSLGKEALIKLLDIRYTANLAQKLMLKSVNFNAEKIMDEPFTIRIKHGSFDRLPNIPQYESGMRSAIENVIVQLDVNLTDVEVIIDD